MIRFTIFLLLCFWIPNASAMETLRSIEWSEVKGAGKLTGGEVIRAKDPAKGMVLRIGKTGRIPIITIESPGISKAVYGLTGEVAYENVEGDGYIEMMNHFPGGARFFSRTLASSGPLGVIRGTSGWRSFMLPFYANRGDPEFVKKSLRPQKLSISVVLPKGGVVYLSSLRLLQFEENELPFSLFSKQRGDWWNARMGGLIGGIYGAVIGCLGALVGILAGRGRSKGLVMALMRILTGIGAVAAAAGICALLWSQPHAVYYPLIFGGGLTLLIFLPLQKKVKSRYEEMEMRKMQALDVN
jgi:hypothetical protein